MAQTFRVKILTLDKVVFDGDVEKLFTKSDSGEIEVLHNYAPSIISTVPCCTKLVLEDGTVIKVFTSNGIINVQNNKLNFCCESSELSQDIDINRAKASKERAERRLSKDGYDVERAELSLLKANIRISISEQ
ncbi:F0F1 ATP synthase subunit epsilon [Clostridium sp. MSJ-8]|uniref:ATP synthase delta/epsilon chain alpha-helix domain-containing protein n=1 Tax=Clostridium sp. MSJ-8 TaxID=2841510 RepID=UPI001C0ED8F9|nr:ATP synthase delta/epsilon chain alpha-helix domain-containing protein [Clostridium sp. MSJ-8]MBU5488557.1 F0F1 ATP synthase subunit epsilon [Clostridium sp. MSJ-8]